MPAIGRVVLETAAALVTLGGLYDFFTPRLPANLATQCAGHQQAQRLVRELLRALGGSLVAIGLAVAILVATTSDAKPVLAVVLVLVLPSEAVNSFCMRRVGSPFQVPLAFAALTLLGVLLCWLHV